MRFCPDCGSPLETRQEEQRERFYCPHCGRFHYVHLKVGAGAVIEQDERLLLLKRTRSPFKQTWNLPAGYVEVDESPEEAVVREVHEETGLHVSAGDLFGVYFFDDDPRGNGILIVYRCMVEGGELAESSEGIEPTFFRTADIPAGLAGGGHDQAIRAWRRNSTPRIIK